MKFYICFLSILIFINSNANIESAHIINDTDQSLRVNFGVPEYSHADISITKINDLQNALHKAILSDSVIEVRNAVRAGADVNMPQDGKRPLLVAILLSRHNAIETLLKLGAKSDNSCEEYITKMKDPKSLLLLMRHGQFNFNIKELVGIIKSSIPRNPQVAIDLITESINHGYDINEFLDPVTRLAWRSRAFEAEEMVRFMLALSLIAGLSQAGFFGYLGRKIGFKNFALISFVGISFPYLFSKKKGINNRVKDGNRFWKNQGSSFVSLLRTNAVNTCDWIKNIIK